jgi:hypothetical protein
LADDDTTDLAKEDDEKKEIQPASLPGKPASAGERSSVEEGNQEQKENYQGRKNNPAEKG